MKTALFLTLVVLTPLSLHAQAPGVHIESNEPLLKNVPLLEKAKALREADKLPLTIAKVKEELATPVPVEVQLPPASTKSLNGREVAARARAGYLRIGWYYLCPHCDNWHLNLAGGYAIAKDAAVTCHHCVNPTGEMREGYLIAVDSHGEVMPVTGISARNDMLDAAVLHVAGGQYDPLPLNDNVAPGDAAYCFSEPMGQHGYFSEGIINRFYWKNEAAKDGEAPDAWKHLRVNVSTDWAPGSSGSAVLDQCGNVIGHVSTISPMGPRMMPPPPKPNPAPASAKKDGDSGQPPQPPTPPGRSGGSTYITLHEAVPARGVITLVRQKADEKAAVP